MVAKSDEYFLLRNTDITAQSLEIIAAAQQIKTVDFQDSQLSNENLDLLSKLRLSRIILTNSNFNDSGAEKLSQIQTLTTIKANATQISNLGLTYMKKLSRLSQLKIDGTKVTFDGVRDLCQSRTLKNLSLVNCPKITKAEEELLIKEFPAIRFELENKTEQSI